MEDYTAVFVHMIDFDHIEYLKDGSPKQKLAYEVLFQNEVMKHLAEFDPVLVGTIPLNIDIENSDLDIICYWVNKRDFTDTVTRLFSNRQCFKIRDSPTLESVIVSFIIDNFEIEIFGQNIPVKLQNGYRHMMIEYELLAKHGALFRENIIMLKKQGYKTEPAFALLLGLQGNPYEELLKLDPRG